MRIELIESVHGDYYVAETKEGHHGEYATRIGAISRCLLSIAGLV